MKPSLLFILLFIVPTGIVHGQFPTELRGTNYFALRDQLRTQFDNMALAGEVEELEREGGPYARFLQWEAYWSSRLGNGRTYEDYFVAEAATYESLSARAAGPKSNTDQWHGKPKPV